MAGVKGKSGGARPGAGRKPKPKPQTVKIAPAEVADERGKPDMLSLLQKVALGQLEASPLQVRAAIAAVQYTHRKIGESGKKEDRQDAAGNAIAGKFGPRQPPKLVSNGG